MADSSLNDEASVIAIDIGGGTTKLALISRQGEVRGWRSFPTAGESGAVFLQEVVEACRQLRAESTAQVVGVSAAVAGFVSSDGALEYNPNLPWLEGVPIAAHSHGRVGYFASMSMPTRTRRVSLSTCWAKGEDRAVFFASPAALGWESAWWSKADCCASRTAAWVTLGMSSFLRRAPPVLAVDVAAPKRLLRPLRLGSDIQGSMAHDECRVSIPRGRCTSGETLSRRIARRSRVLAGHRRSFARQHLPARPHRRRRRTLAGGRRSSWRGTSVLSRSWRTTSSCSRFAGPREHRRARHAARGSSRFLPPRVALDPVSARVSARSDRRMHG